MPDYPKSFPSNDLGQLDCPSGPIDNLGEIQTDPFGRLLVLGGRGRAAAWKIAGKSPLDDDVNNNQWFDDTSDGPVSATIVFEDGGQAMAAHGAWVTATDPSFAPQILNVVSMWDDVYDVWVRELELAPDIFLRRPKSPTRPTSPLSATGLLPSSKARASSDRLPISARPASPHGCRPTGANYGNDRSRADVAGRPVRSLQGSVAGSVEKHHLDASLRISFDLNESLLALQENSTAFLQQWE